ncbi:MAG: RdgB/HAM1 family non-canonical purine NTP pyrophosphatase [Tepidisphaeraceae bacterium]
MHLLIASTNPGKIREFRQMLAGGGGIHVTDLTEHPELPPVEETGRSFLANACLKAAEYGKSLNMWALADDSGLAVDALEGKPGVHSARWAAIHKSGQGDADNNALLIRQLAHVPAEGRSARFVCALALADAQGRVILTASGRVEGRILMDPRGGGGFGYDPLFLVDGLGKTTGELPPDEKHRISHRGKALRRMRLLMDRTGLTRCGDTPFR